MSQLETIEMMLSTEELAQIALAAHCENMTLNAWVVRTAMEYAAEAIADSDQPGHKDA